MTVETVEVRSDHEYIGRPLSFTWQGSHFEVADIIVEYRTPQGYHFQVRTLDAEIFRLFYDPNIDQWSINPL